MLSLSLSVRSQTTKDYTHIWKSNEHPQKYCIFAQATRHCFCVWEFSVLKKLNEFDQSGVSFKMFSSFQLHWLELFLFLSQCQAMLTFLISFTVFHQSLSSMPTASLSHHFLKLSLFISMPTPFTLFSYFWFSPLFSRCFASLSSHLLCSLSMYFL